MGERRRRTVRASQKLAELSIRFAPFNLELPERNIAQARPRLPTQLPAKTLSVDMQQRSHIPNPQTVRLHPRPEGKRRIVLDLSGANHHQTIRWAASRPRREALVSWLHPTDLASATEQLPVIGDQQVPWSHPTIERHPTDALRCHIRTKSAEPRAQRGYQVHTECVHRTRRTFHTS